MRALLDVNVVISLLDPDHAFHERAHEWWADQAKLGWASCPITENGVVRIMSNPGYSKKIRFAPGELILRLQTFTLRTNHEFWPDSLSLRDDKIFIGERIHSSRQLTDFYLLALAAKHGGMLATFDKGIPMSAVKIASVKNLCVL
jgi:uncharacterized protein